MDSPVFLSIGFGHAVSAIIAVLQLMLLGFIDGIYHFLAYGGFFPLFQ